MPLGVSGRALAKALGVSDMAVRKAVKANRIAPLPDGSFDVELCRAAWEKTTDPARTRVRTAGAQREPENQGVRTAAERRGPQAGALDFNAARTADTFLLGAHGGSAPRALRTTKVRIGTRSVPPGTHCSLAQGDALLIESQAKMRLADEYDAAQDRGEVGQQGQRTDLLPDEKKVASTLDAGLSYKQVHEARQFRDAEAANPGIVRRAIDQRLSAGQEPTKAAVREAVQGRAPLWSPSDIIPSPTRCGSPLTSSAWSMRSKCAGHPEVERLPVRALWITAGEGLA